MVLQKKNKLYIPYGFNAMISRVGKIGDFILQSNLTLEHKNSINWKLRL